MPSFRHLLPDLLPVDDNESGMLRPLVVPMSAAQSGEQGNAEHVSNPGFWMRLTADVPEEQEDAHVGVGAVKEQKPAVHEPQLASLSEGVAQSDTVLQVGGGDGGGGEGGGGDGGRDNGGGGDDGGGDMKMAYRFMAA